MELIRIKDVTQKYKNGVTGIFDLDLSIQKGEYVFIL